MAANKFATLLHRNTNKITLILIYAVLEWVLIFLLLLNSLFSYLIVKFAEFFGLKPPCLWCTRLDHICSPSTAKDRNFHRDLLCETHAKEISKLGYCSNYRKLVESVDMCEDCLSSRPEFEGLSKNFLDLVKEKAGRNGEVSLNCSCCGLSLSNDIYSSYILVKTSSWDILEFPQENLISEAVDCVDNLIIQDGFNSDKKISDFNASDFPDVGNVMEDKNMKQMFSENIDGNLEAMEKETEESVCVPLIGKEFEDGKMEMVVETKENFEDENSTLFMKDKAVQVCAEEDEPVVNSRQHLEFFLDYSGQRLVPFELVDSGTEECKSKDNVVFEDDGLKTSDRDFSLDFEIGMEEKEHVVKKGSQLEDDCAILDIDINEEPKLDSMEMEEDESSLLFHAKGNHLAKGFEEFTVFQSAVRSPTPDKVEEVTKSAGKELSDVHSVCEEVAQNASNEHEADVSIGTEIPDLDAMTDEIQNQENALSYECPHEDPSTSTTNTYETTTSGPVEIEEHMVDLQPLSVRDREHATGNGQLTDIEEDKVPDTPTSIDSLSHLQKKPLMLEKRDSITDESLDGSVTSELEGGDGVVTIERLKSALRAERKALQALYAELEEERSSSAVAASQTMAMINRLQEEKAAMQMEALQYQRMMEEQSEYDQEALQLLNELMIKREREKQELEKELDLYKKKLLDYETREKIRVLRKSKDGSVRSGFSSVSCSNAEDSDGLSIDLNQEAREEDGFYSHQEQTTPIDTVVRLEESLNDFEEERLSILEQLKVLEEKLMTLDGEEDNHFEDVRPMEDFHEGNGTHEDEIVHFNNGEANGHVNGFSNGKYQPRRNAGQKGKSLLPLFDAISDENGDMEPLHGNGNEIDSNGVDFSHELKFETEIQKLAIEDGDGDGIDSNRVNGSPESKLEMEKKKLAVEEEVDHLYERLQALEADREFLKHCISSLNKGDKGMDLLQEILQHLHDLRNVELRARSLSDNVII